MVLLRMNAPGRQMVQRGAHVKSENARDLNLVFAMKMTIDHCGVWPGVDSNLSSPQT